MFSFLVITELVILVLFVVLLCGPLEIGELDLWLKKLEVKGGERRRETVRIGQETLKSSILLVSGK